MTRIFRLSCFVLVLAVPVLPAAADTYHVYGDKGIPPGTDLWTWCGEGQPCNIREFFDCATPDGTGFLRGQTATWAGFGIFYLDEFGNNTVSEDLSAFQDGEIRFFVKSARDLKIEFQCQGGQGKTTYLAQHGWDGTATWQEIAIPICSLFPAGQCEAQAPACLADVGAPFLATIENLTVFASFDIDGVRWQTANTDAGASSVAVQGRQLLVNGEPFVVNGMAYSPISIGEDFHGAFRDRPDRYLVDFPLIAASGANTVRLYSDFLTTAMLDAAWAERLYVIPNFQIDTGKLQCPEGKAFMQDRFLDMVEQFKDHPAILFWLVGNEVNRGLTTPELCDDWYPQLDAMAAAAHAAEGPGFHPVGTANADTVGLGDICSAGCSDDTALPNLDLWAAQTYRGCSFGSLFTEYQKPDCDRPLIITEFGADSWDSLLGPAGEESETMQADCFASLLDQADQALAVRSPGGVSSGQVIFSWADEWWKAVCDPGTLWTTHDTCESWVAGGYPDPSVQEEWWGIASLDPANPDARTLRSAYGVVGNSWNLGAVCGLDVVDFDAATGNLSITFDPAAGSTDHTLYYGPLSAVSTYGYTGSASGLGGTGANSVNLPAGSLFWVVAAKANGEEGCYGTDYPAGIVRPCFPDASSCDLPQAENGTCQCSAP